VFKVKKKGLTVKVVKVKCEYDLSDQHSFHKFALVRRTRLMYEEMEAKMMLKMSENQDEIRCFFKPLSKVSSEEDKLGNECRNSFNTC
jgi:hypothetical protein